jgi:hypothetical protein
MQSVFNVRLIQEGFHSGSAQVNRGGEEFERSG